LRILEENPSSLLQWAFQRLSNNVLRC
jgi:hypothetical protein